MRVRELAHDHAGGCTLRVSAVPGARTTEVAGIDQWRCAVRIKIAAPAREGQANAELIRYLSERFSVRAGEIELVSGSRASVKVVRVPLSSSRVMELLGL